MRVSWDDTYETLDAMRNLEAIFLALKAVYEGRLDIGDDLESLDDLLQEAHQVVGHLRSRSEDPAPE